MKRALLPCLLALASVAAPAIAHAQTTTYTAVGVDMYAGPNYDYPRIESIPGGETLRVYGCLSGGGWCDVATDDARGWVVGDALRLRRGNQVVYLSAQPNWVPITVFTLGAYWGSHYQNRPWYNDQYRYRDHRSYRYPPRRPIIRYDPHHDNWGDHGHSGYPDHHGGADDHHGHGSEHGHGNDHPHMDHGHINTGAPHPTPQVPASSDHHGAPHSGHTDHRGSNHH